MNEVDDSWQYCNELLFRSVNAIRSRGITTASGALLPAIFLHLPNASVATVEDNALAARRITAAMLRIPEQQQQLVVSIGGLIAIIVGCLVVGLVVGLVVSRVRRRRLVKTDSLLLSSDTGRE